MGNTGWDDSPIAVVGMACRLPGAEGLDEYWDLIDRRGCALRPLPESRFDAELYYDPRQRVLGKSYSLLGGTILARPLDRCAFPVPDYVAAESDPLHLTLLEVAWRALREAGIEPDHVPSRNAGVYIGNARASSLGGRIACATHARAVADELSDLKAFQALAEPVGQRLRTDVAGRLREVYSVAGSDRINLEVSRVATLTAEVFGLTGPTMAVDAACASSMVALAQAARALRNGRIDMAVVGGASYNSWASLVMFSQAQALSAAGSFPFDARADGFVSSDGYAVVVVKTLARALADGDRIQGVIRGMGQSSDGRGKSLWAPRRAGQVLAINRGLACGIDASRIQYIEAHGTSTRLGDATEIEALHEGLGPFLSRSNPIPVASVKGNIGHTRETAGIAGLIKTLLAMQHGRIPPAAGFETPNPEIPWDTLPFYVPTAACRWDKPADGGPRRAAVDAFGIGGLNMHVLIDDEPECRTGARIQVPDDVRDETVADVSTSSNSEPIAVIGRGAVFPGARTLAAFHDLLHGDCNAISRVPAGRWNPNLFQGLWSGDEHGNVQSLGGFITDFEYDWRRHRIPPKQIAHADPLQFIVLDAAEQALRDAGDPNRDIDRKGTAVVIGTSFGGDFSIELGLSLRIPEFQSALRACLAEGGFSADDVEGLCVQFEARLRERYPALEDETASYTSSTLASRVAKTLDLMGGAFAVDAAGGSSVAALAAGVDMLRSHACNAVLCGGAERSLDPYFYQSYGQQRILSPDAPRAAFDPAANGCVPGEGCGFVMLKRLADAERDGDPIRGVIRGVSEATSRTDRPRAVQLAAERALANGAVRADAVSVIEATGLAVPEIDVDEAAGLEAGYNTPARKRPAWVDSVTNRIGYQRGAAGMASLLKLLAEFDDGRLYCQSGSERPNPSIAGANGALRPAEHATPLTGDSGETTLLGAVSSMTRNGQAGHLLVERRTPTMSATPGGAPNTVHHLFRLEAANLDALKAKLDSHDPDGGCAAVAVSGSFTDLGRARLVIVAEDRDALRRKLALARSSLTSAAARPVLEKQGVFVGERREGPPRIAFAFAGQGSQYPGMLRGMVSESPVAAGHLRDLDATLVDLGLPTFGQLAWEDDGKLGHELFETQLSVLLADVLMYRVLSSEGVRPDVMTAHSYGEYAALVASGAWNLEQAIETTRVRCRAIAECRVRGGMLATTASMEEVARLLKDSGAADVFMANGNAPEQTVVAGANEALGRFARSLQSRGHQTKTLAVPAPFHTPLMGPVRERLRTVVDAIPLRPPSTPMLSSVTNRYTADPLELRETLVEQLVRPVQYVELVRRLVGDGVDAIIEIGPRDVLTKLHRQIIDGDRVGVIATDDRQQAGRGQLMRVRAFLESRGFASTDVRVAAMSSTVTGHGRDRSVPAAAAAGPVVHFDATAPRRERNRQSSQAAESGGPQGLRDEGAAAGASPDDELSGHLIRLVCEQTGYPPEVVELDADLEADLGIDSIKKAQLLGELREHFPIRPRSDLSLSAFPTLRHIMEFIRESLDESETGSREQGSPEEGASRFSEFPSATGTRAATIPTSASAPHGRSAETCLDQGAAGAVNLKRFAGTPYEMGYQHGRAFSDAILNAQQRYEALLGPKLFEMKELQFALDHRDAFFGADGLEELQGIADAVGVPIDHTLSFNFGLSMEFLPGCAQFAVAARWNRNAGLIHGINEDWMLALALPGALKRMVQVRFPDDGIPFMTFSTCGQLAGQSGINARGLAATSTLLLDRMEESENISPGRVHPALIKTVLERTASIDVALEIVREAPRSGAWSVCFTEHQSDRICYVEYDAESVEVRWEDRFVASTNHCLIKPARYATLPQSCQRLDRLHELLQSENRVTPEEAQLILRDRYDRSLARVTTHPTKGTIRRPDTQASIVMQPATGSVWVTSESSAPEDADRFYRLDLNGLLREHAGDDVSSTDQNSPTLIADESPEAVRAVPDRIMNRFVLRMVDAPLPRDHECSQPVAGRVLLLGENPTADAVRERLTESGVEVISLPSGDGLEAALQRMDDVWSNGAAATLLLLTGRDEAAACGLDEAAWPHRREHGVILPYLLCQKWVQLISAAEASTPPRIVAATGLGGDLGLSGGSAASEGGALCGLLKAIKREFDHITTKVIDAPLEDPPHLVARCLLEELESAAPDVEVAYVRGRRRVVRPIPRIAGRVAAESVDCEPTSSRAVGARPDGVWVVTGGGRGVTAIVARELGRRYGLKLHLIGSSPVPEVAEARRELTSDGLRELRGRISREARAAGDDPGAAWRAVERSFELDANLRGFREAGVAATYHSCDISDRNQLTAVLDGIRAADGPIAGIMHGAGFESACRFENKTLTGANATLAAKVDGMVHLATLTRDDPVKFFVGFGSISGRFGGFGQTDYSMSSEMLAKQISRLRHERPECRAVAIHWPVWGDVGMAMRPESKLALEMAGHRFMPPGEGVAHLVDELEAGAPEGEVLLFDWPKSQGGRRSPWTSREAQAYWRRAPAVSGAPLIDGILDVADGRRLVVELEFNPLEDPFLIQHRFEQTAILPFVISLEAFVETARLLWPDERVAALHDVWIHDGMRFAERTERSRVEVQVRDDGRVLCELRSDYRNRGGAVADPSRLYVSAVVETGDHAPTAAVAWADPPAVWTDIPYDSEETKGVQRMVWHGPALQCLKQAGGSNDILFGRIVAPPRAELRPGTPESGWLVPAAVLDGCLLACSTLSYARGGPPQMPQAVKSLRFGSLPALGESCIVLVRLREATPEHTRFDLTLYGHDRRVILDAVDYRAANLTVTKGTS